MQLTPTVLEGRFVRLEPLSPDLREPVRQALDCDPETWAIMSSSAHGDQFDGFWRRAEAEMAAGERIAFAVRRLADGAVVGTTSYLTLRPAHSGVEIGWTFYRPDTRGGPVNPACKRLLFAHAFEAGVGAGRAHYRRAQPAQPGGGGQTFGAMREGMMRHHKITWTGHVRNTVVFSVTDLEWPSVRDGLDKRLSAYV